MHAPVPHLFQEEIAMTASAAVFAILVALWLGAMIPGPSFVLVARNSIGLSRSDGLATALGMGAGGIFFGSVALAGLYTVLQGVEWLYIGLKIAGGAYLIFMASKIWRGADRPIALDDVRAARSRSARKSFWTGLTTQLSNPKTAIWYGSIFAALLPQHPPLWCYFALPPLVFSVEFGWYTIVALCFSSRGPREVYLRAKKWVDRIAAGAIAALGVRLILSAPKVGL
jgi:threonine/homoserine/homoserine lactone efflux protein